MHFSPNLSTAKFGAVRRLSENKAFTAYLFKSLSLKEDLRQRVASNVSSIIPEHWVDLKQGQRAELFEQVYPQQDEYALLMLWLEIEETEEVEDDRTSSQRFKDEQARWR